MPLQALIEYFGTLSKEWALECLKELLVVNPQANLQLVVNIAREYTDQLSSAKVGWVACGCAGSFGTLGTLGSFVATPRQHCGGEAWVGLGGSACRPTCKSVVSAVARVHKQALLRRGGMAAAARARLTGCAGPQWARLHASEGG